MALESPAEDSGARPAQDMIGDRVLGAVTTRREPHRSSEDLTAERVLVNAETGIHPDLVNLRFGYVSVSCASLKATVFTDNFAKLAPQHSADISKTSALKIAPTESAALGIGLGISL